VSDRRAFLDRCVAASARLGHQDTAYLAHHAERLYATWRVCRRLVPPGRSLLSIGAGSAFVEAVLAADGSDVTVVDFAEAIDLNAAYYEATGLQAVAADVGDPSALERLGQFDAVLAGEIVEHVPVAPAELFRNWSACVRPGGWLVVSTPNLGSISSLLRLLFMRPLLPSAELTFGPTSFENEGVHRREYMPSEIASALLDAGLRPEKPTFTVNHRPRRLKEAAYLPAQMIPRFRPTMIMVAKK
jgi:SAM-dependent methyltransferase